MPADQNSPRPDVTQLLGQARAGDRSALDRLMPLVYTELRAVADRQLRAEEPGRTLHATALVHEVYLKFAAGQPIVATDRAHFLSIAAHAMRQVLVDAARRRNAHKRGGDWERVTLSAAENAVEMRAEEILGLDEALEKLEPRQRQIVEYRFFAGLEESEIAALLGVSERTVRREWVKARAWLYRELYPSNPSP
jgi:RNA polymerase sigma factor (TIGR02999 family)